MTEDRLGKFLAHYEAYKIATKIPGEIVECVSFKGTSFVRFALLRELFGGENSSRLIAFDVFSNSYPKTKFKEDKAQRSFWIKNAGSKSISTKQLSNNLKEKNIKNFKLVPGDVLKTIPKFKKDNPGLKISLLNIDIDFVEPTCVFLSIFMKMLLKAVLSYLITMQEEESLENIYTEIQPE